MRKTKSYRLVDVIRHTASETRLLTLAVSASSFYRIFIIHLRMDPEIDRLARKILSVFAEYV